LQKCFLLSFPKSFLFTEIPVSPEALFFPLLMCNLFLVLISGKLLQENLWRCDWNHLRAAVVLFIYLNANELFRFALLVINVFIGRAKRILDEKSS